MRATPLLVLTTLLATGCPRKRVDGRTAAHRHEALATSAELFWRSLRWNDFEGASALLEQTEPRLDFLTLWTTAPPMRVTEYKLMHIEVVNPEDEGDRIEGLVVVHAEGIEHASNVLTTEVHRQTWYHSADNWFLDPDSLPYQGE